MFNHITGYRKLCERRHVKTMKFIESNITGYPLFEKILGFQHDVNLIVGPTCKTKYDSQKITEQEFERALLNSTVWDLCAYNIEYIFSAMILLEGGAIHAYANVTRTVYESIPKIFYMLHRPEEVIYISLKDLFEPWRTHKEYDNFSQNIPNSTTQITEEFLNEVTNHPLTAKYKIDAKALLEKFRKECTNTHYQNEVYSNESLLIQRYIYDLLSSNSHASVFRMDEIPTREGTDSTYMKILTDFSFFNLYLQYHACYDVLDNVQKGLIANFIVETNEELNSLLAVTDLYPKNPEYRKNLMLLS